MSEKIYLVQERAAWKNHPFTNSWKTIKTCDTIEAATECLESQIPTVCYETKKEVRIVCQITEELASKELCFAHPKMDEAYEDGYHTGLNWPDIWDSHCTPGGPMIYDLLSRAVNKAWCHGWEVGYKEKKDTGRSNTTPIPERGGGK